MYCQWRWRSRMSKCYHMIILLRLPYNVVQNGRIDKRYLIFNTQSTMVVTSGQRIGGIYLFLKNCNV